MSTRALTQDNRSAYWDNIKGFLILFVVFGHLLSSLQGMSGSIDATITYIYLFHMPAFVFVSGYFGKGEKAYSFERIARLVFLFFIFNSITVFAEGYTSLLEPIYSYWYLIALIFWRLTAHRIAKFRIINILLFTAAILIGFFAAIDNHFAAARVIGFYPFYMLGYQLSSKDSSKLAGRKYSERGLIGLALLLGAACIAFAMQTFIGYPDNSLILGAYQEPLDVFRRIVMFIIAIIVIYALRHITPDKNIPLITMFGRNSLWIFILHRLPAVWLSRLMAFLPVPFVFVTAVLSAVGLSLAFGNDFVSGTMNKFLKSGTDIFTSENRKITAAKVLALLVALGFVAVALINAFTGLGAFENTDPSDGGDVNGERAGEDIIYRVMTDEQQAAFDNAFRITFAGDLILLEDQVNLGYTGDGYDYSDVFEYAKPYISSADLAVGVFEGPMAGADKGYSSSNFYDNKRLFLNFPDEFASAVKDAGFDLVTTANNHLLDKGPEGALRTLDVLDRTGLDHTGSYRSLDEKTKERVKLVEYDGIKIAVLSYTYGSNYTDLSEFIDGQYSYMTSIISGTEGETFEKLKAEVEEDFKAAKALSPDLIMVLPHNGTQFTNEPDEEQKVWFEIFKENGADIILGDHSHAVQPALVEDYNGRKVFTAYCPGNFANIYRGDQGDTSMLIDVYIDRSSKEIIGGGIVPLYTYAPADGNYRAVPVYDIATDPSVRAGLTTDDIERAEEANSIITEVVFGNSMPISSVTYRYYFDKDGFIRSKATGLVITDAMKEGTLYKAMSGADSICFVGDSVTEGTKNGGCPWYEPVEEYFPGKNISNFSKGGCTISYIIDNIDSIPAADLYVIAIGTNDVRYREESFCAMTAEDFITRYGELTDKLLKKSPDAGFVLIAPWYSTDGDKYTPLTYAEKTALNDEYSAALERYCADNTFMYINVNGRLKSILDTSPDRTYLLDHIHPNASKGVVLYSESVLLSGSEG